MASDRKIERRQLKYKNILKRDFKIIASEVPTKHLMICNAGLVCNCSREELVSLFIKFGRLQTIVMPQGKSYSFISFNDCAEAENCYAKLNGQTILVSMKSPLYLLFVISIPNCDETAQQFTPPPGVIIINNFVTKEEEKILLDCVKFEDRVNSSDLKHRQVKHYGYEFLYSCNNVDKKSPLQEKIPAECSFVRSRLEELGYTYLLNWDPDQLTVNRYQPGQGIPAHIDTHSAFDDPILSLSLGSDVIMDFKHANKKHLFVHLPRRSLLIMSGEARYAWKHGITPRKSDTILCEDGGLSVQVRGIRTSFTFRHIREGDCTCSFQSSCDSHNQIQQEITEEMANGIEKEYVHLIYNEISDHFSETRHKPWPNVMKFIESFSVGSLLVDVGCGNGKYFGHVKNIFEIGIDQSNKLVEICGKRGFQVLTSSCLALPFRPNIADGVICIAVIHHLATKTRRIKAIEEIFRILKPGGKALIYTWAKDQVKDNNTSSYLKQCRKNRTTHSSNGEELVDKETTNQISFEETNSAGVSSHVLDTFQNDLSLPVHSNRTVFKHQDVLVPWKLKYKTDSNKVPVYLRYYHVFQESELEEMCNNIPDIILSQSYYDQGNWCVIIQKI